MQQKKEGRFEMKSIYNIMTVIMLCLPSLVIAQTGTGQADVEIPEGSYSSSFVCGKCHLDIYNQWRESIHAAALDNPVFRTAYLESYLDNPEESRQLCLGCHAPIAVALEDFGFEKAVSKEGVSCDVCHSIAAVEPSPQGFAFKAQVGKTKYGPRQDAVSPAHKIVYSALQTSSLLCASCHEYRNKNGVSILSTYSEWREGPYAQNGIQCQDCHMPLVKGEVVRPEVKEAKRGEINLHLLMGGHSITQLKKSIKLNIVSIEKINSQIRVSLDLTNSGSGHMVPSGIPSRRLVLSVIAQGVLGQKVKDTRTYQKILVNKAGTIIDKDSEVFTKPTLISKDNRIAPKETRREVIILPLPEKTGDVIVRAELAYVYEPLLIEKKEIKLELAMEEKIVPVK